MSEFLYRYNPVEPSTWFYLSSLLLIGLFFKFGRFWSVRNLDLVLLILLGPGLLLIYYGREEAIKHENNPTNLELKTEEIIDSNEEDDPKLDQNESATENGYSELIQDVHESISSPTLTHHPAAKYLAAQKYGFLWLFSAGTMLFARMLADPTMVRRPLLDPNLSIGGLTFIGCSLFVFMMANVVSRSPNSDPMNDVLPLSPDVNVESNDENWKDGPGCNLLRGFSATWQKFFSITSHLAIIVGVVLIAYFHFENIIMGVGAATLYLMLPYTTIMTNQVTHALPSALLVLALLFYKQPLVSGVLLALTSGLAYYPFFTLPLWLSFYWSRGLGRFVGSFALTLVILTIGFLLSSKNIGVDFTQMYGLKRPAMEGLGGIWNQGIGGWSPFYRIPVLAAFIALSISSALWPAQKNFGTLLSCSTSIMVASQFWHGYGGGLFMAWYLPTLLLTIFRPNLEDRVALTVVKPPWIPKRSRTPAANY